MHSIWNPWHGCKKCSAGCEHCYMYFLDEKRGVTDSQTVRRTNNFNYPLKKDRQGNYKIQPGERISVNMTSDTFIEEADEWRDEMWNIIKQRPDVVFWLLTKRPERIAGHLPSDWGAGYENVCLNITCEDQYAFDRRWPVFKHIPAKHKGICIAPFIGPIDIEPALDSGQIEDVECGGENYANPRPCYYEWVKHLSDECELHRTNFCHYETGTNFVYDGKLYFLPKKADQAFYAYMLGLSRQYYPLRYKLVFPNGEPVPPREKLYNRNHCAFCANRAVCNGCSGCGNCGEVKIVTLNELLLYEKTILPSLMY